MTVPVLTSYGSGSKRYGSYGSGSTTSQQSGESKQKESEKGSKLEARKQEV
jgi:hypothetical protein